MLVEPVSGLRLGGELCWVRFSPSGPVERVALARGRSVTIGGRVYQPEGEADFLEQEATG